MRMPVNWRDIVVEWHCCEECSRTQCTQVIISCGIMAFITAGHVSKYILSAVIKGCCSHVWALLLRAFAVVTCHSKFTVSLLVGIRQRRLVRLDCRPSCLPGVLRSFRERMFYLPLWITAVQCACCDFVDGNFADGVVGLQCVNWDLYGGAMSDLPVATEA